MGVTGRRPPHVFSAQQLPLRAATALRPGTWRLLGSVRRQVRLCARHEEVQTAEENQEVATRSWAVLVRVVMME